MSTPDEPLNDAAQTPGSVGPGAPDGASSAHAAPSPETAQDTGAGPAAPHGAAIPPVEAAAPHDTAQSSNAAPGGFRPTSPAMDPTTDETAPGHRPAPFTTGEASDPPHSAAPIEPSADASQHDAVAMTATEASETVEQTGAREATPVTASDAPEEGSREQDPAPSEAAADRQPAAAAADASGASSSDEQPRDTIGENTDTGSESSETGRKQEISRDAAPAEGDHAPAEADDGGVPGGAFDGQTAMDFDRTWQRIEEAFEQKQPVTALVIDRVKGGLIVDIGMQGFVPASHVATGKVHDLERYIGRTLKLRITDLDRERQRVVLSSRLVQEDEHNRKKKETMEKLKVGLVTDGVVRRLTDFGAFVDIGGVDGLLHVSEMSWSRVKHPKEVVSPGDKIKVKVLKVGDDRKKISLGMRQLLPDPWNGIESQFKVGDIVDGRVVRVAPFGAFVQVKDGVEAILPNSEVLARRAKPEELPQVGDSVHAKIIELRADSRRMGLSVRRVQDDQDRKEYQQHVQTQQTGARTTIGDMFGDMLSEWSDEKDKQDEEG